MITNYSSYFTNKICWRKGFNQFHRHIEGPRSMNLVDGGALHEGIAHGLASKDWKAAIAAANVKFEKDVEGSTIPPEQLYLIDEHRKLVHQMIRCYAENWEQEGYTVIQPECQFDLELPDSHHSCIWMHWRDAATGFFHWGIPEPDLILAGRVKDPHEQDSPATRQACPCWQPHRLVGKTDAIVSMHQNVWLLEHKTNGLPPETFWKSWDLDIQPSIYILGIWRAIGLRPRGVIVNAIHKPSEAMVASWNKRRKNGPAKGVEDYVNYERRAFLRSPDDLLRVERVMKNFCDEWEWRIKTGNFDPVMIKTACHTFMRPCDWYTACSTHDEGGTITNMLPRALDYVDEKRLVVIQEAVTR